MDLTPTRFEALMMVRHQFTTEQAMADFFGVTQPTVWRWLNQSKQLPAENPNGDPLVIMAESKLGISRHWLRPDLYPREQLVDLHARMQGTRFIGVDHDAQRVAL